MGLRIGVGSGPKIIKGSGGNPDAATVFSKDWAEVNLPSVLLIATTLYVCMFQGDVYLSSSNSNCGLWKVNGETKEVTQIVKTGHNYGKFFETAEGELFISTALSGLANGLYKLNATKDGITQVYSAASFAWDGIQLKSGEVFFTSNYNTNGRGVLKLNEDRNSLTVYPNAGTIYGLVSVYDEVNDDVYFTSTISNATNYGLWKWNKTTSSLVQVISGISGYGFTNMLQTPIGLLFSSSYSNVGLFLVEGTTFTRLITTGYNYTDFVVVGRELIPFGLNATGGLCRINMDTKEVFQYLAGPRKAIALSDGDVLVGGYTSAYPGLYKIDPLGEEFVQLTSVGYDYTFLTLANEDVLIYCTAVLGLNILKKESNFIEFIQPYTAGGNWRNMNQVTDGRIYVSSTSTYGIIEINNDVGRLLPNTAVYNQNNYFIKEVNGIVYASQRATEGNSGLLRRNPDTFEFEKVLSRGAGFIGQIRNFLISHNNSGIGIPWDTVEEVGLSKHASGTVAGDWVLSQHEFTKITTVPIEVFNPTGTHANTYSLSVVSDTLGNVAVPTRETVSFTLKPIL